MALDLGVNCVTALNELKMATLALSCTRCFGLTTLLGNLMYAKNFDADAAEAEQKPWAREYLFGASHEVYQAVLPAHFAGRKWGEVVRGVYAELGIMLIGRLCSAGAPPQAPRPHTILEEPTFLPPQARPAPPFAAPGTRPRLCASPLTPEAFGRGRAAGHASSGGEGVARRPSKEKDKEKRRSVESWQAKLSGPSTRPSSCEVLGDEGGEREGEAAKAAAAVAAAEAEQEQQARAHPSHARKEAGVHRFTKRLASHGNTKARRASACLFSQPNDRHALQARRRRRKPACARPCDTRCLDRRAPPSPQSLDSSAPIANQSERSLAEARDSAPALGPSSAPALPSPPRASLACAVASAHLTLPRPPSLRARRAPSRPSREDATL